MDIEPNQKKVQGAKTRAELLAAGLQVFAERGYHGATMEDIADAAGTTRGALYWHFADKEDFLVALLEGIIKRRNKQTMDEETLSGSAARLLASSFFFYAQTNQRMPWWNRLIILVGLDAENISPKVKHLLRRAMEPNRYFLARYVRYGQQTGEFRKDIDADQAGAVLATIRIGLAASYYIDPDAFDLPAAARTFIEALLPGLLSARAHLKKIPFRSRGPEEVDAVNEKWIASYISAAAEARPKRDRMRQRRPRRVLSNWRAITKADPTQRARIAESSGTLR